MAREESLRNLNGIDFQYGKTRQSTFYDQNVAQSSAKITMRSQITIDLAQERTGVGSVAVLPIARGVGRVARFAQMLRRAGLGRRWSRINEFSIGALHGAGSFFHVEFAANFAIIAPS